MSFPHRRGWLGVDLLTVLLFVAIGRSNHHHGLGVSGMTSTTWPFALGVGAAWLTLWRTHRAGDTWLDGALVAVVTVAVGMVLRVVSGQGTAPAFIVVALAFNGALMVASRVVASRLRRRALRSR